MSKTVLLADDSVTFHKIVEYSLLGEGLNVIATKSAEEAMMRARQQAPSLIIADTYMPKGRSGVDLAAAMRNDPKLRHVPVILLASKAVPFDEAKAQQLRVAGFLAKPFQSQELLDKVRAALSRAAQPSQIPQPSQAPAPRPASSQVPPPRPAPGGHTIPPRPGTMPPQAGVSQPPPARSMPPPARPGTLVPPPPTGAGPRSIPPPPRPGMGAAPRPPLGATHPPPARPQAPPPSAVPPPRPGPTMPPAARPMPQAGGTPGPVAQGWAPANASQPPAPRPAAPSPANHEALLREALSKATREMIEKVVWEVVPDLAEAMIREELARLIKERGE